MAKNLLQGLKELRFHFGNIGLHWQLVEPFALKWKLPSLTDALA